MRSYLCVSLVSNATPVGNLRRELISRRLLERFPRGSIEGRVLSLSSIFLGHGKSLKSHLQRES